MVWFIQLKCNITTYCSWCSGVAAVNLIVKFLMREIFMDYLANPSESSLSIVSSTMVSTGGLTCTSVNILSQRIVVYSIIVTKSPFLNLYHKNSGVV